MYYNKVMSMGHDLDYAAIGRRIRNYRKEKGYSQEKLAELINISTTHMSHIETGGTKLSLAVFAAICEVLSVQADHLLHDVPGDRSDIEEDIIELLESSNVNRLNVYYDMLRSMNKTLKHYDLICSKMKDRNLH